MRLSRKDISGPEMDSRRQPPRTPDNELPLLDRRHWAGERGEGLNVRRVELGPGAERVVDALSPEAGHDGVEDVVEAAEVKLAAVHHDEGEPLAPFLVPRHAFEAARVERTEAGVLLVLAVGRFAQVLKPVLMFQLIG